MPMKKYMCIASFSAAILFAAVGMAIPPQGVIDGSVLILAAQLFVLCATFLGLTQLLPFELFSKKFCLNISELGLEIV